MVRRIALHFPLWLAWAIVAACIIVNLIALCLGLWDYRDAMEDWPGWGILLKDCFRGVVEVAVPLLIFIFAYSQFVVKRFSQK
jgi:hypothetical protein